MARGNNFLRSSSGGTTDLIYFNVLVQKNFKVWQKATIRIHRNEKSSGNHLEFGDSLSSIWYCVSNTMWQFLRIYMMLTLSKKLLFSSPADMETSAMSGPFGRSLLLLRPQTNLSLCCLDINGDLPRKGEKWFEVEASDRPCNGCCWNPVQGLKAKPSSIEQPNAAITVETICGLFMVKWFYLAVKYNSNFVSYSQDFMMEESQSLKFSEW